MQRSLIFILLAFVQCGIHSVREGETKIHERFLQTVKNSEASKTASLLVHSDRLKLHVRSASGTAGQSAASPDQPFHVASIGKLFTAVVVYQLVEEKKLSLNDPAVRILGPEILRKLFEFQGKDYSGQVTIDHLLSHKSGAADYFESVEGGGRSVLQEIPASPGRFWTSADILDFARTNQQPVARPGEQFHYSDTGYVLLGLVVEKVTGKSFERNLEERIYQPLGMKHTYMHLRSEPAVQSSLALSTMMLGKLDATAFRSVSADWAGGGIVSTAEDLLLFHRAVVSGKLISSDNYKSMQGSSKFMDGIYYGRGLMTVRFGDMSAIMPKSADLNGHSGLLSTLLFYSPEYDTHIIANLGSTDDVGSTFEMMFWILQTVKEIQGLQRP